jgi:hypothetical protein
VFAKNALRDEPVEKKSSVQTQNSNRPVRSQRGGQAAIFTAPSKSRRTARTGLREGTNPVGDATPVRSIAQEGQIVQQAFMLGKNARLRDERPIDVLRAGDVSSVVTSAAAFGEHGAA